MKVVILSGASGGMGLATAKELTRFGYFVYGLDINNTSDFDNFKFIKTDLTKQEEIDNAFEIIKKETNEIDAIINMAGIYDLNSLIEMGEEEFIRIFNINVFAMYRLNKTFLPLLKEKGKIFITSSELAPLEPLPFTGIYGITKTTVEKYAYSLRMELQLLDYQVVVIRPGAVNTGLLNVSTDKLEKFCESTTHYEYNSKRFKNIVDKVEAKHIPPEKIGALVGKIIQKKKPKYVYKINRNSLLILLNVLPKRLQNRIIKNILIRK